MYLLQKLNHKFVSFLNNFLANHVDSINTMKNQQLISLS
ncbi:MAG: hypothetical protein CLLPBCKN_000949 [Chroococcidiopsis cubana SAG 39.79]|nr:hypothetical protein [Chroococcidiopsis cubana SAG 39.79]